MSWSIYYSGKVKKAKAEVRKSVKAQAPQYKDTNEGRILEDARKLIAVALKYNDPEGNVSIQAHGHAITSDGVQVGQNLSVVVSLVA